MRWDEYFRKRSNEIFYKITGVRIVSFGFEPSGRDR